MKQAPMNRNESDTSTFPQAAQEEQVRAQGYRPLKRLFLNGSRRVIIPISQEKEVSWLEQSPLLYNTWQVSSNDLLPLVRAINPHADISKLIGDNSLGFQDQELDETECRFPASLWGKIKGARLEVVALFINGEEEILKLKRATVTNFECEWVEE